MRVFLVGFGNVGREAAKLVRAAPCLELAGAANSRGAVVALNDAARREVARLAETGERLEKHWDYNEGLDPVKAAVEAGADYAIIAIPPSYETGEPNRSIVLGLLDQGIGVGLADKTVPALFYDELVRRAEASGAPIGLRATVMAGTPATDVVKALASRSIERIRGVLNATTNYILTMVEEGASFQEAIKRAVEYKLAEPDPTVDTHGLDAAAKLVILVRLAGYKAELGKVERVPLESIGEYEVRRALAEEARVKYVATADPEAGVYKVAPEKLPSSSPLARVDREYNAVELELEGAMVTLTGPTGPAWRTARVLVGEALDLSDCSGAKLPSI